MELGNELTRSPKRGPMPARGLVVFESRRGPGFFGDLEDTYAKFHLLIAGRAFWEGGGRECSVTAGTLFHIAAQVPHRQRDLPEQPVTLYAIHYRPDLLAPDLYCELSRGGMLPLDLRGPRVEQGRQVRAIVQEMLFEQEAQRFGWEALLVSRLTHLAVISVRLSRGDEIAIDHSDESIARVASYATPLKSHFFRRCRSTRRRARSD